MTRSRGLSLTYVSLAIPPTALPTVSPRNHIPYLLAYHDLTNLVCCSTPQGYTFCRLTSKNTLIPGTSPPSTSPTVLHPRSHQLAHCLASPPPSDHLDSSSHMLCHPFCSRCSSTHCCRTPSSHYFRPSLLPPLRSEHLQESGLHLLYHCLDNSSIYCPICGLHWGMISRVSVILGLPKLSTKM